MSYPARAEGLGKYDKVLNYCLPDTIQKTISSESPAWVTEGWFFQTAQLNQCHEKKCQHLLSGEDPVKLAYMAELLSINSSRKNFKSLLSTGIVLAVGVSNLHISSNENVWCHSVRVTSPGNIKGPANHSRPLFASSLASSRTDQSTWESTFSLLHWLSLSRVFRAGKTFLFLAHHRAVHQALWGEHIQFMDY